MAKIRLTGATFTAAAKTVTHASFSDVGLAGIQLITNVTDQIIIYNFADTTKGGTLATDTLTLEYDTTSMSDTDELMILVEDGVASTAINDGGNIITVDGTVAVTNAGLTELAAAINASSQMDVNIAANGIGLATSAKQDTIIGHLDGVEGLLTTIDADTGNISTKIDTLAGAVAGTEMQVDVLTMPTVTVNAHAVTNAGTFVVQENGAALTALQLIDDSVATLGTTTYTEAATKGLIIGAVRRDADTTLVDTTNEVAPLQLDARGFVKTEVFSGETLPVSLTSTTITGTVAVTQSGTWDEVGINDSGNSITVDNNGTFVTQVDGSALTALQLLDDIVYTDDTSTHTTGTSKGALIMAAAAPTDTAVNANDIAAVGMTVNREMYVSLTTALPAGTNGIGKLTANSGVDIGDVDVTTVGTITPGTGATNLGKARDVAIGANDVGIAMLGVRRDSPTAETPAAGDYIVPQYSANGEAWTRLAGELADDAAFTVGTTRVVPTGLLADETSPDSVDEGDIGIPRMTLDRKAISTLYPSSTTGDGLSVANFNTGDTFTALTNSAQVIKASAGNLYGYYIYNPNSSATYVMLYNIAAASVTVGTSTPAMVFAIPATSGANLMFPYPIPFTNAGWSIAAATTGGGNTAPATALEAMIFYR